MLGSRPADHGGQERFDPRALAEPPAELVLSRLPPGRHGLPRDFVARNQRLRLAGAMLRALPRHGYAATTIGHVTEEAGVSRAAFYRQFHSKEKCFLATHDLGLSWVCERVATAVAEIDSWPAKVRAGAREVLALFAANPDLAHLLAVEAPRAGPAARCRQQQTLARFAEALRDGRPVALRDGRPVGERLPAELEQLLLGGALSLIARYVESGRTERLPEATGELVQYLLIPYMDSEKSRRIAEAA